MKASRTRIESSSHNLRPKLSLDISRHEPRMERLLPVQELIPPGLPDVVYPTASNHAHQDANGYWVAGDYVYQAGGEGEEGSVGGGGGGPDMDPSLSSTWAHSHSLPHNNTASHSHSHSYFSHPHPHLQSLDEQHSHSAWSAPHTQNQMDDGSGYASMDVGYDDQDQGYAYNGIDYSVRLSSLPFNTLSHPS